MLTYAQNFEDVILARLFSGQKTGFYIDVGASHPDDMSVTKHFYDLGWSGINIEPIPSAYYLFTKIRPRDINLQVAIDVRSRSRIFYEVTDFDALSTFDPEQAEFLKGTGYTIKEYQVNTITLNDVFQAHVKEVVDFLKIDVEGTEEAVLNSIDLAYFRPRVLVIEATKPARGFPGWDNFDSVSNWSWESLVISKGYLFAYFDGISRFYVRSEDEHLLKCFQVPPGFFDDIHRPEEEMLSHKYIQASLEIERLTQHLDYLLNLGIRGSAKYFLHRTKARIKSFLKFAMIRCAGTTSSLKLPKISIVTPVFNGEAFIHHAIESVLTQEYPELEYIIVDGGSTDRTLEIIQLFELRTDLRHRISSVISEPDNGMYDALAKGFSIASGEIFCYLNSDDTYEPNKLQTVGEYFAQNPTVSVVYHDDIVLLDGWKFPNATQPNSINTFDLINKHILFQDGVFWRRTAYELIGGFRRDLKYAGDFDFWLRLSKRFGFNKNRGHISCFRVCQGQLSVQNHGKYIDEMHHSIREFIADSNLLTRILYAIALKLPSPRLFGIGINQPRFYYPFTMVDQPFPAGFHESLSHVYPASPIDNLPADRLLFSTPDTRFGDQDINTIYYDSRNNIAIAHPPIESGKLDELYRKYYSNPPTELLTPKGSSPFRGYNKMSLWEKIFLRFPIGWVVKFRSDLWADNTLSELSRVLLASDVDINAPLRFLDVGCFEGHLLDQVDSRTKWQAFGFEPNINAVAAARAKGHFVWQGLASDILDIIPSDCQFDVIYLGQSIEHMDDPVSALRRLRLLLAPGGTVVLSTPNLDSREIDWFGPTWAHWHPPYHRYIFSKAGLCALSSQVGLLPTHIQSFSHPYWTTMSLAHNALGLAGSASHAVHFERHLSIKAQRIYVLHALLWNRLMKGDYLFFAMKDTSYEA